MPTDLRFSIPAVAIVLVCGAVVVARATTSPAPKPARHATAAERAEFASFIATQEKEWSRQVVENFPQDNWSQRDDFHGREYKEVLKVANEKGIRPEDLLRAIDEDLHKTPAVNADAPDTRAAHAVPCKPRPFYD